MTIRSGQGGPGYFVKRMKPVTYVFNALSQQGSWANCDHADTLQFEVKPGQLLYLGEFDGAAGVGQLQRNAMLNGNIVAMHRRFFYCFDGITPPRFAPVDYTALDATAAWARAEMPRTTVAPVAATFRPARFGTGRTLFGAKVRGGYFKQKVEPAAAPVESQRHRREAV